LAGAYKYVSEAWGGYHWDVAHGLNVDAGIFVSYIGLFSYYNFDNWTYQPSFVSSNTPWFFNGLRIQYFPTKKLKIEPWIVNGWQSYARANGKPGLGGQILWRPKPYLDFVFNNYGLGEDAVGFPGRSRVHADYSAQVKYYDKPSAFLDKAAFTITGDAGCEYGGGPSSGPFELDLHWRGQLPWQQGRQTQAGLHWLDGLHALLVQERSLCCNPGRRPDEQPWPLSNTAAADQRCYGHNGYTLLYRERWGSLTDARRNHHV